MADRMSVLDLPFWDYGNAELRQVLGILVRFQGSPPFESVSDRLAETVAKSPRLRQHVVDSRVPILRPRWEAYADLDLAYHVRHLALPPPADETTLAQTLSAIYSQPLDLSRPLWEAHYFSNLDTGAALFLRVNHSLADAIAANAWIEALADVQTETEDKSPSTGLTRAQAPGEGQPRGLRGLGSALREFSSHLNRDRAPIWEGPIGAKRRVSWVDLSLPTIKEIRTHSDATVNDVFQTALSMALETIIDEPLDQEITASMPLSVRDPDELTENALPFNSRQVSLVLPIPMQIRDPRARLEAVSENAASLKQARGDLQLVTKVASYAPRRAVMAVTRRKIRGCNLISSTFLGSRNKLVVSGQAITAATIFTALAPGCPLALVAGSYLDSMCVGITADPDIVPHVESLPDALQRAVDELHAATA